MTRARTRMLSVHRSTLVVLVTALLATGLGAILSQGVVQQSERRLLSQRASAAGLIMSSMLSQSSATTSALVSTIAPDGTVNQAAFEATSQGLRAPADKGGAGVLGTAILDASTGKLVRSSGGLVLDLQSATGRALVAHKATVAAADPGHVAILGAHRGPQLAALGLLTAPVRGRVAYVEFPVDARPLTDQLPPLFAQAFGGLEFAVYLGSAESANLLFTNDKDGRLEGESARVATGGSSTNGFGSTSFDPDLRPMQIVLAAQTPLTGAFAHRLPWILALLGLLSSAAVIVLMENAHRRRDEAVALVDQLKVRNTEIQEAVERREQAEDRLAQSQRLEAIGQLAGGIAHDFNNLLAVIFSYAGFLKAEAVGKPWAEDVEEIDRAAHRAAELTSQLLMFSRRDVTRPSVVDLRALVADRFRLLQRTLGENIEVTLDLPEAPLAVRADSVELDQVVMNLVVNARDAMPDGGQLRISLREVPTEAKGTDVQIMVSDTGTGMNEDVLQHAFEPFYTTKEVGRGTGLGLATVYGIATRCGGSVTIDSTVGTGTTVTVAFPRCEEDPDRQPGSKPLERGVLTGRVLLVEDDVSVRRVAERILSEAGFTVVSAGNGPEALARFAEGRFDILVSDVVMPGGMSGPELADLLREDQPDLPVVLASGHARDHLTRRGPLPRGTQVVGKPFDAAMLLEAVQRGVESLGVVR
jgi:signal transduction histidine kinase